jgi:hypothetical protein
MRVDKSAAVASIFELVSKYRHRRLGACAAAVSSLWRNAAAPGYIKKPQKTQENKSRINKFQVNKINNIFP